MELIKELLKSIDKNDIKENDTNLVSDGILDSLDIMALVSAIEKHFNKPLKAEFIEVENFESFAAIHTMLQKAMV